MIVFAVLGVAAPAAHASLSVPPPTAFTSAAAFEAAAGGADNGTTPGERGGGFRHFTPGGIAVDGSDLGSTAIPGGHTAALAPGRLQPWGLELGPAVAVADDGFRSVNSHAAFSPPDLWAPFNSNTTEFQIVAPATAAGAPAAAVSRGLGIEFVNVENSSTTIQYYSGSQALLAQPLQVPPGATSFAGVLFDDPVVTRVAITLGTAAIFGFDGSSVTPGGTDPNTLAAGDDVVVAEPGAGETTAAATAGVPVSASLASFDSSDTAADITATVNWGDGTATSGTIVPESGGVFAVTGSHSYALPGSYTASVTVQDFGGSELITQALIRVAPRASSLSVTCSPSPVAVTASTMCTATVADAGGGGPITPTGTVAFSSPTAGASFASDGGCVLGATGAPGAAICEVQFTPTQLPPTQARIDAAYGGDVAHTASSDSAIVRVRAQRCTLNALPGRLKAHPAVLGIIVTCDARANVTIGVKATGGRNGSFKAFTIQFGSLRATVTDGRPTVLVIKPSGAVLGDLRAASRRHQRVSLKLTLTATSHATRATTTTRVAAVRIR
ncbi:MAG: PKD domain-containing protein [Solirubrobacterales bacterium]|nr:PKD domain-containing protein [Solirubrobacterales bacterium]